MDMEITNAQRAKVIVHALPYIQKYKDKITVLKIDIDENSEIAEKYSIQSVPTSILFKNSNIVERVSGMISFNQCSDLVDKYLN